MDCICGGLVSIRCQAHALVPAGLWGGNTHAFHKSFKKEAAKSCLAIFPAFNTNKVMHNLPTLTCNFTLSRVRAGQVLIYVYYECFPQHVYGIKTWHKPTCIRHGFPRFPPVVFRQRRPASTLFKLKVLGWFMKRQRAAAFISFCE